MSQIGLEKKNEQGYKIIVNSKLRPKPGVACKLFLGGSYEK